jgi:hypothetical protein
VGEWNSAVQQIENLRYLGRSRSEPVLVIDSRLEAGL